MKLKKSYLIHNNLNLKLNCSSQKLLYCVERCLSQISVPMDYVSTELPELEINLTEGIPDRIDEYQNSHNEDILQEIREDCFVNIFYKDRFISHCRKDIFVEYYLAENKAYIYLSGNSIIYYLAFAGLIPIINLVLLKSGFFLMHASAVSHEGIGILLIAPSGVGKSTTATLLAKSGFAILHDDLIWFQEKDSDFGIFSVPAPIRLNHDVLDRLAINPKEQDNSSDDPTNKYLFIAGENSLLKSVGSAKCCIVCFLERNEPIAHFKPINPIDAIERLTTQSYFVSAPFYANEYLRTLIHLSEQLPLFIVDLGTDISMIPAVFHQLVKHYSSQHHLS